MLRKTDVASRPNSALCVPRTADDAAISACAVLPRNANLNIGRRTRLRISENIDHALAVLAAFVDRRVRFRTDKSDENKKKGMSRISRGVDRTTTASSRTCRASMTNTVFDPEIECTQPTESVVSPTDPPSTFDSERRARGAVLLLLLLRVEIAFGFQHVPGEADQELPYPTICLGGKKKPNGTSSRRAAFFHSSSITQPNATIQCHRRDDTTLVFAILSVNHVTSSSVARVNP
ncbi:hypothetical protein PHSY_005410 [Pseudozyma hubeiensis SY62]|uniref:Uncharacterized protein n=1 Tax=Pseudozyma hubeiensis (strain SY62) TaxID=1305764 RepID=R9P9B9_PSEHS|nr:hypothetical protein PHSY_005410 [Pseudozyma hubeiensis SY62]GAC97822.1 hypothetical protein PHSY_005410 [Pseudozyma hubeiensis SY62]